MLLVTLSTAPPQPLLGYTCTAPLAARSSATHPVPSSPSLRPVNKWLNVPYASAERWSKPTPYFVDPLAPTRDCFEFGANPLQGPGAVEPLWYPKEGWLNRDFVGASEDCLSLNVFVPKAASEKAKAEGRLLPVMVRSLAGFEEQLLMDSRRSGSMVARCRLEMPVRFDTTHRSWFVLLRRKGTQSLS